MENLLAETTKTLELLPIRPQAVCIIERFHNEGALSGIVQGGIFFHPSDEDLSLGTPVENAT